MDGPDFPGDFKNAGLAQKVEQWTENPCAFGAIPKPGTIIKVGDFYELGERKWVTWRLVKITKIEKENHVEVLRTVYYNSVLAYNHRYTGHSRNPKFWEGAPVMGNMKKVEYNDLPMYIGAPYITNEFQKVFRGE